MTTTSAYPSVIYRLVVALLLGARGRALLLNAPSIADGLLLRFDEAVSLLAALSLGGPWGALVSLLATVGTPEPTYSAMWATEALLVGVASARGIAPVMATAGYWLLVSGIFWSGVLAVPQGDLDPQLGLAKQLVNGVLNAALAQAVMTLPSARRLLTGNRSEPTVQPVRVQFARALVPVATIPLILLGLGLGVMHARQLVEEGVRDLEIRADTTATFLTDYVATAEGDVATLAGQLSHSDRSALAAQPAILLHHSGSTAFLTMLVADAEGTIVAAASQRPDTRPIDVNGIGSVADRPYFLEPRRTGRPYRSDSFLGRGFGSDPVLALSAPILGPGEAFAGIAQGSLNLLRIGQWLDQFVRETQASMLVLDRAGQVIASAGPHAAALLTDARTLPWVQATNDRPTARVPHGDARPGRRQAEHLSLRRDVPALGWQVHVRRPVAAMQTPLTTFYTLTAAWLLVCLALALPLASRVAKRITQPIELLAQTAEGIGRGHAVAQPVLPANAPAEVVSLQRELSAMVERLDESVVLLDQKVRERSAELAAVSARSDTMFRAASDGMLVLEADG